MNAPINITKERYGRLVAVKRLPNNGRRTVWLFKCDCGNQHIANPDSVRSGLIKSCGCLRADIVRARSIKHGHSVNYIRTPTLKSWAGAKGRCYNKNDEKFPRYGKRGIRVCKRWRDSFEAFLADMGEKPKGLSLHRINNDGDYEPKNCKWATSHEQARERSDNVFVEHDGVRMILTDFAALMGVSYKALHRRVKYESQTPHAAAQEMLAKRRS